VIFEFLYRALAFIVHSMEAVSGSQNLGNKIKSLGVFSTMPARCLWV
jgi:hypothetical protein